MSDILDLIDAATEERCACGCGSPLAADGPSAWFIDSDHQSRYHEARATDPRDVYRRPDAAPVYVEEDHRPVPLVEPVSFRGLALGSADHPASPLLAEALRRQIEAEWYEIRAMALGFTDEEFRDQCRRVAEFASRHPIHVDVPEQALRSLTIFGRVMDPGETITGASLTEVMRYLQALDGVTQAKTPPADPMLAAIEAKRNRNTGPPPRERAPGR